MTIPLFDTPGKKLTRTVVNAIINALNSVTDQLAGSGVTVATWAAVSWSSTTPTLNGSGPLIASITGVTQGVRLNFAVPFEDANDYACTCTCTLLQGSDTGYAQLAVKDTDYVEFIFRDDDGSGGYPFGADFTLTCNVTA